MIEITDALEIKLGIVVIVLGIFFMIRLFPRNKKKNEKT
jgi:hypothetical protein